MPELLSASPTSPAPAPSVYPLKVAWEALGREGLRKHLWAAAEPSTPLAIHPEGVGERA